MNILAQIFGLLAISTMFYSYMKSNKKDFLLVQTFTALFYGLQYLILNAFSAVMSEIISLIRCIIFLNFEERNKRVPVYVLAILMILLIILGIYTFENVYSIIPIFIACLYTYGAWQKNLKITYTIGVVAAILWIIYNFIVGAYVSIIGCVIELIGGIIGLIRIIKNVETK